MELFYFLDCTGSKAIFFEDGKMLQSIATCDMTSSKTFHMGSEYVSREKKFTMVNFFIFVQKNVSTIRFQEIKIRPFKDFEKMRFLCFYIIKSMARKGYFGPRSDFRGCKIPPRGASST